MFQAMFGGWKRLAAGLVLVPGLAGSGDARAQSSFAEESRHTPKITTPAAGATPATTWGEAGQPVRPVRRDSAPPTAPRINGPARAAAPAPRASEVSDPKILVRQGREALDAGKLEAAQDLGRQADALKPSAKWGLFEDSPRALLKDVQKAKSKRDRADSVRMMAEARMLFDKKAGTEAERASNLERAQNLCYQAERLHGPYSVWDFGDRPTKLLAEIDGAKSKLKTPTAVARKGPTPPAVEGWADKPGGFNPSRPDFVAKRPGPKDPMVVQTGGRKPAAPNEPAPARGESALKARAVALMQQANTLAVGGNMVDAYEKLQEAKNLHAPFAPDEDSPDVAIANLQSAAARKIAMLCNEASEHMVKRDAASTAKAENALNGAEQLAKGMGLDTHVVNEHRASMAALRGGGSHVAAAQARPAVPMMPTTPEKAPTGEFKLLVPDQGGPDRTEPVPALTIQNGPGVRPATSNAGVHMLGQARLELKKGDAEAAKRLAIEILSGDHRGVKEEAQALLRTIEAEEFTQRRSTALKSFQAAQVKYNAHDYAQALSILQLIDPTLLSPTQRNSCREMMGQCSAHARTAAVAKADPNLLPAGGMDPMKGEPTAVAPMPKIEGPAAQAGADSLIKQQEALQEIQFQKLRSEGLRVQSESTAKFGKGDTEAALSDLAGYVAKVKQSSIEPSKAALLTRPVENRLEQLRVLKQQQDFFTKSTKERSQAKQEMSQDALTRQHKSAEIKKLMNQFQALMDEHKYSEAQMLAMKAQELDPDDPSLLAAVQVAKVAYRNKTWQRIKDDKENWNYEVGNEAHKFGPPVTMDDPLKVDPARFRLNQSRPDYSGGIGALRARSPKEKEIERLLNNKISLDFKNTPLEDVIAYIRTYTALNVTLDSRALEEKNISPKHPVTETLRDIELKSALNIILKKCNLTHVIEDNALKITTAGYAQGRLQQRVFPVADLVIPIENFGIPETADMQATLKRVIEGNKPHLTGMNGPTPYSPQVGLTPGTQVGNGSRGTLQNTPAGGVKTTITGPKGTMEEALIKLITNTVKPESWSEVGGPGTIDYYPIGLALVINQTPDVVEQVADLLESLRRLQDLEVAIEIRLITLAEAFFERLGLDFSLNIKTNPDAGFEQALTSGVFTPAPFINDINTKGQLLGLTPAGTFTPDLDIPIRSTSFQQAIPPFGGFQNLANNGGLTLGLAFLNDIQVFMFLEASQGDRRTNVMQAPKLTMFNGQSSQIQISDQQFFVTGITVVSVNGQIVFVPQNSPFSFGVTMSLQPVVSADRRFVRININQQMTNLASAVVPLFPITTFVTPVFEGGAQGQPIPFTQFIQQPTIASLNVQTTVIVPDGGTVMIGGMKTLSEGRNEFGPPVLSKIPYINRLFKNVGYGREAQTMMMMVTPRVIVNREEQERQTGVVEENYSQAQ